MLKDPTHIYSAWLVIATVTAFAVGWAIARHRAEVRAVRERYGPFDACFCEEGDEFTCDAFKAQHQSL